MHLVHFQGQNQNRGGYQHRPWRQQRGAEKVINQITTVLSIVFFVVAIVVVILPKL